MRAASIAGRGRPPRSRSANPRGRRHGQGCRARRPTRPRPPSSPAIEESQEAEATKRHGQAKPAIELADKVQGKLDKLAEPAGRRQSRRKKIERTCSRQSDQDMSDAPRRSSPCSACSALSAAITLHLTVSKRAASRDWPIQTAAQNALTTKVAASPEDDSVEDEPGQLPAVGRRLPQRGSTAW